MNKFLAEFIGTYALVFFGTGTIIVNQEVNGTITNVGIAIIFGLIVMAMIYTMGNVSGAHINPAVSIAFTLAKRFPLNQLFPYICCQIAGGIAASMTLKFLFPLNVPLGATFPQSSITQSFILELILTFFLMLVIIKVATGSKEQGMFAGITIGSVVALEAMFAGPICGASMNPARSVAPAVVSGNMKDLWIYIFAPIIGAAISIPISNIIVIVKRGE